MQQLEEENAELREKLENLRTKRKEDLAKLTEFDNLRIQFQTLVEYKSSATEEMRNYRRRIEETEARLAETEKRLDESSIPSDLESQLEMLTLDKELAEQKLESAMIELTEKKTKIEELEVELELLKTSMEEEVSADGEMAGNSVQVRNLNQQLEKCQAVIIRMRDIVNTTNMEKQFMQQNLEEFQKQYETLQTDFEKKSTEISGARAIISDLQEQVDSALGSTKMVEHLTASNLDLEERLRNALTEKEHLYEMYLLSEDIAAAAKEEMQQSRLDSNSYLLTINERDDQISQLNSRINDYENVIQKFRQKISDLNDDIVGFKDQVTVLQGQMNNRSVEGGSLATFNASKDFSKVVSGELDALELKYSNQLAHYLKDFLPDNFNSAGGDYDCVLLTVFFPKVAEKAELLVKLLADKYPEVTNLTQEHVTMSHKGEQWAHVRRFNYQLLRASGVMWRFESVTKTCTPESLQRLAMQRTEITSQEKVIDQYFDLLKQQKFDENTSCDILEHCVNTLNKIFIINLSASDFDACAALHNYLHQLKAALAWAEFNCLRLKLFLLPEHSGENDFTEYLDNLIDVIKESSSTINKTKKFIPQDKTIDWSHDVQDTITCLETLVDKVAKILHESAGLACSQLTTNAVRQTEDVQGFSIIEMKEFIQSKVEKMIKQQKNIPDALHEVTATLTTFKQTLEDLSYKLEKKEFEKALPPARKCTPLKDRAEGRRQDVVDVESLRWQLQKKDEEYKRVCQAYKASEDAVSTYKIQLEREKKRLIESGKPENILIPADKLEEAIKSETGKIHVELEEAKTQLKEAELARDKLKKELELEKKGKLSSPLMMDLGNSGLKLEGEQMDVVQLKNSLIWTQDKVRRLQAELSASVLSSLKPLKCPDRVCGRISLADNNENSIKNTINSFLTEADILSMEYKKLTSVNVKDQGSLYRRNVVEYNNRVNDLRFRLRSLWEKKMPQSQMPIVLQDIEIEVPKKKKTLDSSGFASALAECKKLNEERSQCFREILSVFN
ncbi:unnamed protein product [Bursaphelenchus okinawaensis]|uniref:Dynein associated protein domain-containing protein n=1 Tax=Bursaphelenchus okinawaensis TaxID=465554 RepID=A0A811KS40_9BILA|nr:unnamed protein product [Bursaphelenchus okinawaensis]CAG9112463.1 unnamed protein product [Bursaphelenchus okinawaensis]